MASYYPKTDTDCWVRLYSEFGISGDYYQLTADEDDERSPVIEISSFENETMEWGSPLNDNVMSVSVGPRAWVELYKDYGPSGDLVRLQPNTIVSDLGRYADWGGANKTSAIRVYNRKPSYSAWDEAIIHGNASAITNAKEEAAFNRALHGVLAGLLSLIPGKYGGGIIRGLFDFLWPEPEFNPDSITWQQARLYADYLTEEICAQMTAKQMSYDFEHIHNLAEQYVASDSWNDLVNLVNAIDDHKRDFINNQSPATSVRYLAAYASMHLLALSELIYFGPDKEGFPTSNSKEETLAPYQDQFDTDLDAYTEAVTQACDTLSQGRRDLVRLYYDEEHYNKGSVQDVYDGHAYDVRNSWNGRHWHLTVHNLGSNGNVGSAGDVKKNAQADVDRRKQAVGAAIDAELDWLRSITVLWTYANPDITSIYPNIDGQHPISDQIQWESAMASVGPHGGPTGGDSNGRGLTDCEPDKRITHLDVWAKDDLIRGIQLSFDGEEAPLRGWSEGDHINVTLDDGEYIVAAWGGALDGLQRLGFRTNTGREFGVGREWWDHDEGEEDVRAFFSSAPSGTFGHYGDSDEVYGRLVGLELETSYNRVQMITYKWKYRRCLLPDGTWPYSE